MSWSAVLLENRPGHLWQKFDLGRWAIFLPPLHRRSRSLLHHLFDVVVRRYCLSSRDDVQVREASVAHHAPDEDLQGLLDRLHDRHLRAVVGPYAVVLAVGRLENLEGRLIAEEDTPPVLDRPVLAGFGEFQPPALLVLGQPGLQLEFEQLQLEAGLQIAVFR